MISSDHTFIEPTKVTLVNWRSQQVVIKKPNRRSKQDRSSVRQREVGLDDVHDVAYTSCS